MFDIMIQQDAPGNLLVLKFVTGLVAVDSAFDIGLISDPLSSVHFASSP